MIQLLNHDVIIINCWWIVNASYLEMILFLADEGVVGVGEVETFIGVDAVIGQLSNEMQF